MALLKGIGKQIQIGIRPESTRGSTPAVLGAMWMASDDFNIEEKYANAIDTQIYGVIEDNVSQTRIKNWSEGSIKFPISGTTSAVMLFSMFGTSAAVLHAGETAVWDNTINVLQTVQHKSLSFYIHDPIPTASGATADYSYANAVVHKMDIEYSLGNFVFANASIKAQSGSAAAVVFVPSQAIEDRFIPQNLTFKVASTATGLTAATVIKIKSAKITIDSSEEDDDVMGSLSPRDFLNKEFKIEGTIEAIWQNESDFRAAAIANTVQALRLDLVNANATYGSGAIPLEFRMDLAKCYFTEFSRPVKIKDVMYQTISFKAAYSITDGYMARILFTNTLNVANS